MAILAIDFSADRDATKALGTYLSDHGFSVDHSGDAMQVSTSSLKDCKLLGKTIAEFVSTTDVVPPLHVDGPGGESVLRRLRTKEDEYIISGLLATCAAFQ